MLGSMITNLVAKHFKKKLNSLTITEEDVSEVLREIRIALLDADVNLLVVKNFIKNIKEHVVGQTLQPGENAQNFLLLKIKEELINILGKSNKQLITNKKFINIMLVGLQGSGKTTSCAKIANLYKTKFNKKVLLVGIDIYRPAAIEQLRQLAKENKIDFFEKGQQNPVLTADQAFSYAKNNGYDVVIYDTAGRLQTNQELMDELKNVQRKVSPDEIIMAIDAASGQNIVDVATTFNDVLSLTGFMLTKMDGDARAGAALSLISLLNVPIKAIGTGEKVGSIDNFYPERMADRILGLGDVMTLAEKAQDVLDENQMKKSFTRMLAGKMDLEDMMVQLGQISKLGSLGSVMKMMPGNLSSKVNDQQIDEAEEKIRVYRILLSSMTLKERRNPILLKKEPSRKTRIIKGSGRKPEEFNRLYSEWEKSKEKMEHIAKSLKAGKNPFMR